MSEPHTLEAGASDPIRLMQVAQATMALACLATKEIEPRAKMQEAEAAIYDVLTAAGGKIDPSAAALASSAGPVPDEVREAYEFAETSEAEATETPEHGGLRTKQVLAEDAFRRSAAKWVRTLLATPSGRPDTPPAGGGAVDGPWSDLLEAARPFAGGVFHDNGDVTLNTGHIGVREWVRLSRAVRALNAACCGPERESYVKDVDTGEPLGPNDPIPAGRSYEADAPPAGGGAVEGVAALLEAGRRLQAAEQEEAEADAYYESVVAASETDAKAGALNCFVAIRAASDRRSIALRRRQGAQSAFRSALDGALAAAPEPAAGGGREIVQRLLALMEGQRGRLFEPHESGEGYRFGDDGRWMFTLTNAEARAILSDPAITAPAHGSAGGEAWQPITTAPKNRAVQVCVPGLDYYGNQGVYAGMLVDMGTGPRWMTFAWAMGRVMVGEYVPTRWRNLPAPPTPATSSTSAEGK